MVIKMRQKMHKQQKSILISFPSLFYAIKMEKICSDNKIKGKLIPIPREISAGCGISWVSEINLKNNLKQLIDTNNILIEKIYEIIL